MSRPQPTNVEVGWASAGHFIGTSASKLYKYVKITWKFPNGWGARVIHYSDYHPNGPDPLVCTLKCNHTGGWNEMNWDRCSRVELIRMLQHLSNEADAIEQVSHYAI